MFPGLSVLTMVAFVSGSDDGSAPANIPWVLSLIEDPNERCKENQEFSKEQSLIYGILKITYYDEKMKFGIVYKLEVHKSEF